MSDDLSDKFAQISELLNQEGMAENIKGLIGMLSKSTEAQGSPVKESTQTQNAKQENHSSSSGTSPRNPQPSREMDQDLEMMRQVQKVMEVMRSTKDDPRINLLNAIMPYMNPTRQKKVTNAMRILQVTSMTRIMDKDGKSLFKL